MVHNLDPTATTNIPLVLQCLDTAIACRIQQKTVYRAGVVRASQTYESLLWLCLLLLIFIREGACCTGGRRWRKLGKRRRRAENRGSWRSRKWFWGKRRNLEAEARAKKHAGKVAMTVDCRSRQLRSKSGHLVTTQASCCPRVSRDLASPRVPSNSAQPPGCPTSTTS